MDFLTLLGIALALAMDAFAVSIAVGIELKRVNFRQTFRLSWHFGLFQALMPVVGWLLGHTVHSIIEAFDHWIAFILLAYIGFRMIREALADSADAGFNRTDPTKGLSMVMLSVATSIDAFAVGLSLSMLQIDVVFPAVVIGIVALLMTIIGLHLGSRVASLTRLSSAAEVMGGVILWIIGLRILHDNGVFSTLLTG